MPYQPVERLETTCLGLLKKVVELIGMPGTRCEAPHGTRTNISTTCRFIGPCLRHRANANPQGNVITERRTAHIELKPVRRGSAHQLGTACRSSEASLHSIAGPRSRPSTDDQSIYCLQSADSRASLEGAIAP